MIDELRHLTVEQAYAAVRSSPQGLSRPEARTRLGQSGPNRLETPPERPWALRLWRQFSHTMALLLWAGGALAWLADMPQLGVAIWTVNLINGGFSFWQEFRAERATEELKRLLPHNARVIREGRQEVIAAEELVPGDVIVLYEGDHVCADARLVMQSRLRVDQSCLTGEAMPVTKSADPIERDGLGRLEAANVVFAGSAVAAGSGTAVIFATGMSTEFGKIARLTLSVPDRDSPLQMEVRRATTLITYLALGSGLVFLLLALTLAHMRIQLALPFALGVIVAFVPEGLAPTLTLALAMGVQRMAGRRALVKRLASVETLGAASVICTDKTGTLTQNQMTVRAVWDGLATREVSGLGYQGEGVIESGERSLHDLLRVCALCNDAQLREGGQILGDPMEAALLVLCRKGGMHEAELRDQFPRLACLPFDSRRRRMTTVHNRFACMKGAPSAVLPYCRGVDVASIRAREDELAAQGLRILAVAHRPLAAGEALSDAELEADMEFLGLVAMQDPPRPEVPSAIQQCHAAGIRLFMITGDHGVTGVAIARQIGLLTGPDAGGEHEGGLPPSAVRVILGSELDQMHDEELRAALQGEVLFARATPENKLKVVEALQALGHVVAVTGDGVNDAPALKRANIGIAMGISGSDVAREAADMILADDSFASIVYAIEEGRAVYDNIRRFISYIFTSNVPEAVPLLFYAFSAGRIPLALNVMQILSVDLGTDMLPALALGAEPPAAGLMKRPPRRPDQHLLDRPLLIRACLWLGLTEAALAMGAFFLSFAEHGITSAWPGSGSAYREATTLALGAVVAAQIGNVWVHRPRSTFPGPLLWAGILVELGLLAALAWLPIFQSIFETAPLSGSGCLYLALCPLAIGLVDWIRRRLQGSE